VLASSGADRWLAEGEEESFVRGFWWIRTIFQQGDMKRWVCGLLPLFHALLWGSVVGGGGGGGGEFCQRILVPSYYNPPATTQDWEVMYSSPPWALILNPDNGPNAPGLLFLFVLFFWFVLFVLFVCLFVCFVCLMFVCVFVVCCL